MLASAILLAATLLPQGATSTPPADLTLPPETAQLLTILEGRGDQIYTCAAAAGTYTWTFKAPEAKLFNLATGKQQGRHDAGPTWTLDDGSAIRGTALQKKAGDTPTDVPWLLLQATALSSTQGTLTPVSYVRRYNTHGGSAPAAGCTEAKQGETLRVPYTATYAFYTLGPALQP